MSSEDKEMPTGSPSGHSHLTGGHLPEGSSVFQEVMAELVPRPKTPEPVPRVRKVSRQEKHVHYSPEEGEAKAKDKGPDHQILHGMCHCYFVHNGDVKGFADHSCQHQHKKQPSPGSSPRMARKAQGVTPDGSPKPHRKVSNVTSPHHHHLSTLAGEEFRTRAHSDTSAALVQRMKRASLGSRATPSSPSRPLALSVARDQPSSPSRASPSSPVRRVSSFRTQTSAPGSSSASPSSSRPGTATGQASPAQTPTRRRSTTNAPPYSSSSPPPIRVQKPSLTDEQDILLSYENLPELPPRRKTSTHLTPSDELHFLYDQYLKRSADTSSDSSRQRSNTVGAVP